jgi:MFS family permease
VPGEPVKLRSNRAFALFWSARTISFTGTGITTLVLPVLVYRLTDSPGWVASLSVVQAVPYLALGLLAGAMADRIDRKKIMVGCDAAAAILLAAVPAAAALHHLVLAQLLVVALGVATAFVWFDAANFGTLTALVDRAQLPVAASLVDIADSSAMLIAPTLGAALLAVMSPAYALGFDAVSYLVSAVLLASVRRPFGRPRPERERHGRIGADIAEGLRFLWHQPVIRTLTLSVFCVCLSWGGTFGLLVVYASRGLHLGSAGIRLGLLYSVGELGGLLSAVALPVLIKRLSVGRMMVAFMVADIAGLAFMAVAPSYGWALLAFFLYELSYVTVITAGIMVRQLLTPDHLQARVNTTGRMIAWGGSPVGAGIGGVLATFLPVRLAFGLLAIGSVAGAVLAGWACLGSGALARVSLADPAPTVSSTSCAGHSTD